MPKKTSAAQKNRPRKMTNGMTVHVISRRMGDPLGGVRSAREPRRYRMQNQVVTTQTPNATNPQSASSAKKMWSTCGARFDALVGKSELKNVRISEGEAAFA